MSNDLIARLRSENAKMHAALCAIAALYDESANAHLLATGSYGGFDEPGSVQIARDTLVDIAGRPETEVTNA